MTYHDGGGDGTDRRSEDAPSADALLDMSLQARTQALLDHFGLRPRQALSQNFLINEDGARALADTVVAGSTEDALVIEIGAGLGALTVPLAQSGHDLIAYETDLHLIPALQALLTPFPNARLEHADITEVELGDIEPGRRLAIAGNLPYHLTGLLLRDIMEIGHRCDVAMVTVQAEVGDRLTAGPGDDAYGVLSVFAEYYFERIRVVRTLGPGVFLPRPDVQSTAMALYPYDDPAKAAGGLTREHVAVLPDVIRGAFGHRRKTLRNSLATSPLLDADKRTVSAALDAAGVDGSRRAEELSLDAFVGISVALAHIRGDGTRDA